MPEWTIGHSFWRAAALVAVAALLIGCSPSAVSTQVSNVTGTGVAVATQVGPTAAAIATNVAGASGTALPGAQQTAAAVATTGPGIIGSVVAGARPTVAAVVTTLPGNAPLRVGQFVAKAGSGTGGVQVIATPGGAGVVRLNQDFSVNGGTTRAVYLTREASPGSRAEVERGFIDLGPLRSISGQDAYPIPPGTDINAFNGVVIYDTTTHAPLIAAPLARP